MEIAARSDDQGLVSNYWKKPFADTITLPGATSGAGLGTPLGLVPTLAKSTTENLDPKRGLTLGRNESMLENGSLGHLFQRYAYVGPAWYRRSFEIYYQRERSGRKQYNR